MEWNGCKNWLLHRRKRSPLSNIKKFGRIFISPKSVKRLGSAWGPLIPRGRYPVEQNYSREANTCLATQQIPVLISLKSNGLLTRARWISATDSTPWLFKIHFNIIIQYKPVFLSFNIFYENCVQSAHRYVYNGLKVILSMLLSHVQWFPAP
jgi:hypothetical protein